jgi:hypothetical protein
MHLFCHVLCIWERMGEEGTGGELLLNVVRSTSLDFVDLTGVSRNVRNLVFWGGKDGIQWAARIAGLEEARATDIVAKAFLKDGFQWAARIAGLEEARAPDCGENVFEGRDPMGCWNCRLGGSQLSRLWRKRF